MAASKFFCVGTALLALLFTGCASKAPAPVSDGSRPTQSPGSGGVPPISPATTDAPRGLPPGKTEQYTVKKGDTLYSVALEHGQNYRDVAAWNGLTDPSVIKVGQQLRMTPPEAVGAVAASGGAVTRPVPLPAGPEVKPLNAPPAVVATGPSSNVPAGGQANGLKRDPRGGKQPYSEGALAQARRPDEKAVVTAASPAGVVAGKTDGKPDSRQMEVPAKLEPKAPDVKPPEPPAAKPEPKQEAAVAPKAADAVGGDSVEWGWPHEARVTAGFSEPSNKGLDFAGKTGSPVLAAADGKVSYTGTAIRGYGNLVIVQHNKTFLSVYAHNSRILVKEGQTVSKGMKIAELGSSDADQPKLHFEIRRNGKPIDPAKVLPQR